jgi:adenosylmethionine-8-amino-7-oxononanoate aminotransferase
LTTRLQGTAELRAVNRAHVWHPFTQMEEWNAGEPLVIAAGDGCELIDTDGNRYLDGVASLWANVHGHRVPRLDAALAEQAARIAHCTMLGLANVPATELAGRLAAMAPGRLEKVFYAGDGACAVEIALKMAFEYWALRGVEGKETFLKLEEAYHGDTVGAVSVGGIDLFHRIFGPLLFDTVKAPTPNAYRREAGLTEAEHHEWAASEMERLIAENADRLAAVVVEPLIQAAAGMLVHPPGYLRRVRDACDRNGVLMIVDEVATGFGRTGRMLACEAEGVEPDLMTLGKGLTGGYLPLSAVLTSTEVFDAFLGAPDSGRTFYHGHTYTGNPLAAAVALANLDLFEEEDVVGGLPPKIRALAGALEELIAPHPAVGDIRHLGMMVGIELVADRVTRTPFALARQVGNRICARAVAHGVVMRPLGDVLVLMPPLAMSVEQLERLVEVTAACIREELG